ncbi:MAG: hypothetical protein AB8G05_08905 [Oligoflexales bacterium]
MISLPFKVLLALGLVHQSGSFSPTIPSPKLKKLDYARDPAVLEPTFIPWLAPVLKNELVNQILNTDRENLSNIPIIHKELLFEAASELKGKLSVICEETLDKLALDNRLEEYSFKVNTKGIDYDELHKKIVRKIDQRNFFSPSQLSDIVRARINLTNFQEVSNAAHVASQVAIKHGFQIIKMQQPKRPLEPMKFGYPRIHLHLKYPNSPITCEIQLGTIAFDQLIDLTQVPVSDIRIIKELKRLKLDTRLHYIDYKIFRFLLKKHRENYNYFLPEYLRTAIQEFCDDLDDFASEIGLHGYEVSGFQQKSKLVIARASELLKLIHSKGFLNYIIE